MLTCSHSDTELRFRIYANGARAIQHQCKTCGAATSSPLKQSDFTTAQLAALFPWDATAAEKWYEQCRDLTKESIDRRTEAFRIRYAEYLKSDLWLHKRDLVLERDGHLCQGCRIQRATQVHHLTYEHVFDELLFELTSLCAGCHKRTHGQA